MTKISVLMITVEWPDEKRPSAVPFLVRQVELLRQKGIDVDVFSFKGAKNPFNYLKAARLIRRKLRLENFDVIHAQWGQSAVPVFFSKLPLIVTFRGSDLFGITKADGKYSWPGKVLQWVSRRVALRASRIIVVSSKMINHLPPSKRSTTQVIPSGINLNLFTPMDKKVCRATLNLSREKKLILFGGHPAREDKRYALAVQAVGKIQKAIKADMFYADQVSLHEMPVYINAADVVLLTSKHEGSPNIIKESLACNVPVVSVDVGDVRERIEKINGCKICDSDRVEDIATALLEVLQHATDGFESRSHVLKLDENQVTDEYIVIYQSMVS
jgi:glycosyltransferase involved in cell wall biosynthesis